MKYLIRYIKPYKKECTIGPFCKLMEAILELLLPTIMAYMINEGILLKDHQIVMRYSFIMIGMVIIGFLFSMVCQYNAAKASQGFGTDLRNALFSHICAFSYQDIDQFGTSSLVNRLSNDVNQLQIAVAMLIRLVIRSPFICIGAIMMSMFLDFQLSLILLGATPLIALILFLFIRYSTPMYQRYQKLLDQFSTILDDHISGVRVIRAFVSSKREKKRFESAVNDLQKQMMNVARLSALLNPCTALVINGAVVILLYQGILQTDDLGIEPGTLIAFINYASSILLALVAISNLIVIFTKAAASAQRVEEVLTYQPSIREGLHSIKELTDNAISFDHVSFSYGSGEEALSDITLQIKRGETIGIIGGTGAGKTTLMHLLCRFYEINKGRILLFGQDIKELRREDLLQHVVLVPQVNELFCGTIEENIRFGCQKASMKDIEEAIQAAQAREFIAECKDGLQTKIERGGANLSGGQRQRLCIARALLRNPSILILDDSSSALDFKTDALLRSSLTNASSTMTRLIVSQRVGSLLHCDRILVLDNGRIAGFDQHQALYDHCLEYQKICESQAIGRDDVCRQEK